MWRCPLGAGAGGPIQRKSPGARGFWCSYACGILAAEGAERPPCGAWADTLRCFAEAREASLRGEAYAMEEGVWMGDFPIIALIATYAGTGSPGEAPIPGFLCLALCQEIRVGVFWWRRGRRLHTTKQPRIVAFRAPSGNGVRGRFHVEQGREAQRRIGRSADEPRHGCGSLGAGPDWPIQRKSLGAGMLGSVGRRMWGECSTWNGADRGMWGTGGC